MMNGGLRKYDGGSRSEELQADVTGVAGTSSVAPYVLYLHGRHALPDEPPGDLVGAVPWPIPLVCPAVDGAFLRRRFEVQMREVDAWLDRARLAIGHSYGAWLLLCAALGRIESGRGVPPLFLMSAVLGASSNRGGEGGSIPPRARRVRRALGLEPGDSAMFPRGAMELVHGDSDDQCPVDTVRALGATQIVSIVPGGHRLMEPGARAGLHGALERHRSALVREE
jgi:hypothetical protein